MNAKLYLSSREISLQFETEADRDLFLTNLRSNPCAGFSPALAAEKIDGRSIRFDPSKFETGWVWPVVFPD